MRRALHIVSVLILAAATFAQAPQTTSPAPKIFEAATIKPSIPDTPGRYLRMQDAHRFIARNESLKGLLQAAWNLNPRAVSGGPSWIDSDPYDIDATSAADVAPGLEQQMAMLRLLLQYRFHLQLHREPKELPLFRLLLVPGGPNL